MNNQNLTAETLYIAIAGVIQQARHQLRQVVNQQMVQAYWHIGRLIVEEEQRGQERAEHGKQMLKGASTPGNAPLRLAHNGHQPTRY